MRTQTLLLLSFLAPSSVVSFISKPNTFRPVHIRLYALPDIEGMKVREIKQELDSYGISTKSFFEKREMVDALKKARAEGKEPIKQTDASEPSATSTTPSPPPSKTPSPSTPKQEDSQQKMRDALDKAKTMKVSDLRKELKAMGINTQAFFEKTEFEKAYAEAIANGKQSKSAGAPEEQEYDPSYRDVSIQKIDRTSLGGQQVIDVKIGKD